MEIIFDFIKAHYKLIVVLVVALFDLIMVAISLHRLTKKGLVKDSDILAYLGEILPKLIIDAECLKGGTDKLALVICSALRNVKTHFGLVLDDSWTARIRELVESYLSTPQKKE